MADSSTREEIEAIRERHLEDERELPSAHEHLASAAWLRKIHKQRATLLAMLDSLTASGAEATQPTIAEMNAPDYRRTIVAAIGGSYELSDGRTFWLDEMAVQEIVNRLKEIKSWPIVVGAKSVGAGLESGLGAIATDATAPTEQRMRDVLAEEKRKYTCQCPRCLDINNAAAQAHDTAAISAMLRVATERESVIEECAKVAEEYGWSIMPDQLSEEVGKIAARIRSLSPTKRTPT